MNRSKLAFLLAGSLALAACGGQGGGSPDLAPESKEAFGGMEMESQNRFMEVRQQQQAALDATAAVRKAPEKAAVEDLEKALNTLNRALLRARREISALRSDDAELRRPLMKELREANHALNEAYRNLMAHHPNPTPEMMQSGADPES
jgi:small-conductance mechanosensitive channel